MVLYVKSRKNRRMTYCYFLFRNDRYVGFKILGHVGLGTKGKDIVCAAVSAVAQATLIGLEEVLREKIRYKIDDGLIKCDIKSDGECAQKMIETLHKTILQLSKQYPKNLSVSKMEV